MTAETQSKKSDAAYVRGLGAGFTVAFAVIFWFTTYGVWCLGCMRFRDARMDFLTAQGRGILNGHLWVPLRYIGGECIRNGDQCYGYFGIGPSLLRIPYLLFVSSSVPDVSQVYVLLGFALALVAIALLLHEGWRWFAPQVRPGAAFVVAFMSMMLLGLGSPLFFLGTRPWVYEEVILWGVAFALMSMWAALVWLRRDKFEYAMYAAGLSLMAGLSRPHMCLAGLGFLLLIALMKRKRTRKWNELSLLLGVSFVVAAAPFFVNYLKFHETSVPYERHIFMTPDRLAKIGKYSGEDPRHVPTQLVSYFRPDGLTLESDFPYVDFFYGAFDSVEAVWPSKSGDFESYDSTSFTATEPLFLLLLLAAGFFIVRRRGRDPDAAPASDPDDKVRLSLLFTAAAFIPFVTTLAFYGVVERYKADAMPFLVWATVWTLPFLVTKLSMNLKRVFFVGVGALTAYQLFVSFGLSLVAYPSPSDAPGLASLRLDKVSAFIGHPVKSVIWTAAAKQKDDPLAVDPAACGPASASRGEQLSVQVQLPPVAPRVQTMVQYDGPTIGFARVSNERVFIVLGLRQAEFRTIGPLAVQGTDTLSIQRIGDAGKSCISWNGAPLTLSDITIPGATTAIGENVLGSSVTTDDFTGKVLSVVRN